MGEAQSTETWRPVVGYEGFYEVCSSGQIRRIAPSNNTNPGGLMKLQTTRKGYQIVRLHRDGVGTTIRVHRVVAAAFIGPRPAGLEINHLDGDKGNNCLENIEYVTPQQNTAHAYRVLGRKPARACGERAQASVLVEEQILAIRRRGNRGERQCDLAQEFEVSRATISDIMLRKTWRHV